MHTCKYRFIFFSLDRFIKQSTQWQSNKFNWLRLLISQESQQTIQKVHTEILIDSFSAGMLFLQRKASYEQTLSGSSINKFLLFLLYYRIWVDENPKKLIENQLEKLHRVGLWLQLKIKSNSSAIWGWGWICNFSSTFGSLKAYLLSPM